MIDLLVLNLREAYRKGFMEYEEFRQRFNKAMKEAANDR